MFNARKHKGLVVSVVVFLTLGLILTYVPLLFPPSNFIPPAPVQNDAFPADFQSANLEERMIQAIENSTGENQEVSTTTLPAEPVLPASEELKPGLEGFEGLDEEQKSFEGIDTLFEKFE